MTTKEARAIERPAIVIGQKYRFYSTLQGTDGGGVLVREYTGQDVMVQRQEEDSVANCAADAKLPESEREHPEPLYMVVAQDGVEFSAWEGELNGWFLDTGQYYNPGKAGPTRRYVQPAGRPDGSLPQHLGGPMKLDLSRFSDRGRNVIRQSAVDASNLGDKAVGPEHILMALVREPGGAAFEVFGRMFVSEKMVLGKLSTLLTPPPLDFVATPPIEIEPTERALGVISGAAAKAREAGAGAVGTGHILLSLFDDPSSVANVVLISLGLNKDSVASAMAYPPRAWRDSAVKPGKSELEFSFDDVTFDDRVPRSWLMLVPKDAQLAWRKLSYDEKLEHYLKAQQARLDEIKSQAPSLDAQVGLPDDSIFDAGKPSVLPLADDGKLPADGEFRQILNIRQDGPCEIQVNLRRFPAADRPELVNHATRLVEKVERLFGLYANGDIDTDDLNELAAIAKDVREALSP